MAAFHHYPARTICHVIYSFLHPCTYSFFGQVFIEHLLYARSFSKHWGETRNRIIRPPFSRTLYSSREDGKLINRQINKKMWGSERTLESSETGSFDGVKEWSCSIDRQGQGREGNM